MMRDNQTFMSLYFEPNAVEFALGVDSFLLPELGAQHKQFGQVATLNRLQT